MFSCRMKCIWLVALNDNWRVESVKFKSCLVAERKRYLTSCIRWRLKNGVSQIRKLFCCRMKIYLLSCNTRFDIHKLTKRFCLINTSLKGHGKKRDAPCKKFFERCDLRVVSTYIFWFFSIIRWKCLIKFIKNKEMYAKKDEDLIDLLWSSRRPRVVWSWPRKP
jgi:hypothetical protein